VSRPTRSGVVVALATSWLDRRDPGPAVRALLAPASWGYGAGAWLHRHARGPRFRAPVRLPCTVVSVGSLLVGGAGKTPAAAWIAARLSERGHTVAIASRGYGRARPRPGVTVVSDGRRVRATPERAGDEPLVLAAHAPGVPVLVGRDRARVGQHAIALFGADVLVLDDGFQHHRLARDVEVLAFDGAGLGSGLLLPRGPLRESLAEAARADFLLAVDGPLPEDDAQRLARHAPAARPVAARRRPLSVRPLAGGPAQPPAWLAGREVGLLAGLARPAGFRRTLEALGARVVAERCFADHHRYRPRDLRGLAGSVRLWVTTEKDAVKILPSWCEGLDVRVLAIELEVEGADAFVAALERAMSRRPGSPARSLSKNSDSARNGPQSGEVG
jgi:tetraacyldisaccharide 4'-kinase